MINLKHWGILEMCKIGIRNVLFHPWKLMKILYRFDVSTGPNKKYKNLTDVYYFINRHQAWSTALEYYIALNMCSNVLPVWTYNLFIKMRYKSKEAADND